MKANTISDCHSINKYPSKFLIFNKEPFFILLIKMKDNIFNK